MVNGIWFCGNNDNNMTIIEALKQGIANVRKPQWNPTAKLELPPKVGDGYGPWCKLHDVGTTTDITIFEADDRKDDWLSA